MSNSEADSDSPPPPGSSVRVQADIGGVSHRGCVRANNEDHFLVVRFDRNLWTLLTNLPEGDVPQHHREGGYAMVVADGMGGATGGEVASRRGIGLLIDLVLHTPDWMLGGGAPQIDMVLQRMTERYRNIDAALTEQGSTDPSLAGMGTTMTLAASLGTDLVVAHIGDSRAYLLHAGQLHQLTQDHTVTQQLLSLGLIRPDEAATHRLRHVLTRVLGGSAGLVKAECQSLTLSDGDRLLLCTDGLTNVVNDATIGKVLLEAETADKAGQVLLALAMAHGGPDNVTAVVAHYRITQTPQVRGQGPAPAQAP
jgi:protein phosphatase